MGKQKVHLAGADPITRAGGSVYRLLGCCNSNSELAISVRFDSNLITTDPAKVTCCHCRVKMARKGE